MYTQDEIKALIESNNKAVLKGILTIYNKQTKQEQRHGKTISNNRVGFSCCDAKTLTNAAKKILAQGGLKTAELELLRPKVLKYSKQLMIEANAKLLA